MMTPILKTARLTLRPPMLHEQMDVSYYLKWLTNERVVRYSEQRHKVHTEQTQYEYLCSFGGSRDQIWEIVRDDRPIGSITADRDPNNRSANVAIMIGEMKFWGSGYGPEAWEIVCSYLLEDGIRKIEAGCMARNRSMISLLKRCGFTHEATLPNYFLFDGHPEDMHYYGKYREAKIIPLKAPAGAEEDA